MCKGYKREKEVNLDKLLSRFVTIQGNLYRINSGVYDRVKVLDDIVVDKEYHVSELVKYDSWVNKDTPVMKRFGICKCVEVNDNYILFKPTHGRSIFVKVKDFLTDHFEIRIEGGNADEIVY